MPVPHNRGDGRPRRGLPHPALKLPRRDLRYAAFVSLGLIAVVLVAGAAITPLVGLNDWPSFPGGGPDQPVHLGNAPPTDEQQAPQRSSRSGGTVDRPAAGGVSAPAAAAPVAGSAPGAVTGPRPPPRPQPSRPPRGPAHAPAPQGRFPAGGIEPTADTDGDGLPDKWERYYGTDPNRSNAGEDSDGDGLSNAAEFRTGTNPQSPDTNG